MAESDILDTDFETLEKSIRAKLMIEIFHNMHLISDEIYFEKYSNNAESLDRDYKIWMELKES